MSQAFNPIWQQTLVFSHYFQVLQAFRPYPASLPPSWLDKEQSVLQGPGAKAVGEEIQADEPQHSILRGPVVKGSAMPPLSTPGRGAVREESQTSTETHGATRNVPHLSWTRGLRSKRLDVQA